MKHKIITYSLSVSLLLSSFFGCSKLIEVDTPRNQLTTDKVFADSASAIAALANVYFLLANNVNTNFSKFAGLYADEYAYTASSAPIVEFHSSNLSTTNGTNVNIWNNLYLIIYSCNDILEQVALSTELRQDTRNILTNEARFLRAYSYFYLQNLYGHVPLLLQTDVDINRLATQSDSITVYSQIMADLQEAKAGLSENYQGDGKVRANRWAASALLARVHLYQGRHTEAEQEASAVINSGAYSPLGTLAGVFHNGSRETILQFWTPNGFIGDATTLIPASSTVVPQYTLTDVLYDALEEDDLRKGQWTTTSTVSNNDGSSSTYYRPYKYKNRTANATTPEYLMALRLSEQYLIRAEARANQGNIGGAVGDLNVIRDRAGLTPLTTDISIEECLAAVMQERQVELFGEWGHRFFDLKRTGQLDAVMAYKDTWSSTASVFPIPQNELTYNTNLVQNEGY